LEAKFDNGIALAMIVDLAAPKKAVRFVSTAARWSIRADDPYRDSDRLDVGENETVSVRSGASDAVGSQRC